MANDDNFMRAALVLKEVTEIGNPAEELGHGTYGRVYTVSYLGDICAAKEIQSKICLHLIKKIGQTKLQQLIFETCIQYRKLLHPNIVKFIGVYYPTRSSTTLPAMVMEMMSCNLSSFVDSHQNIPIHIKYSIVHDISLGLCYLHNRNPPIVYHNLFPNNILLTDSFMTKISDVVANEILGEYCSKASDRIDFMAPEVLTSSDCSTPVDVFSFAGIILYIFNQQWPRVSTRVKLVSIHAVILSEVAQRQEHLDRVKYELRPLVMECLSNNPAARPSMETVSERIRRIISKCVRVSSHNVTMFNKPWKPLQKNVIRQDSPPLIPALHSGRYTLKWTRLADLPVPMNFANVASKDDKIFVTACSSFDDTFHHLYVYDVNKDDWHTLPPSGHWDGIPHIVGDKLVIIGGYLLSAVEVTNKVSTFNEDNQTWISYYPDMLSSRRQPGVVSYLEYVIVLGGINGKEEGARDDIEVLDWQENLQWKRVSVQLPEPMWAFTPSTCDDKLVIVGYHSKRGRANEFYMIPINAVIASAVDTSVIEWNELSPTNPYWSISLLPNSSPPVIVGGRNQPGTASTDCIKIYDSSDYSWKTIARLQSPRGRVAVATISNNSIIVIGGIAQGGGQDTSKTYNLTLVELGQAELTKRKKPSIIDF